MNVSKMSQAHGTKEHIGIELQRYKD